MTLEKGFSLVELMIVVAIIGLLAAIGIPQYNSYVLTQKIRASQADLVAASLAMESRYNQQMSYPTNTGSTANSTTTTDMKTALTGWAPAQSSDFYYTIKASSGNTYTLEAKGYSNKLTTCTISIDQANTRSITSGCSGATTWF